MAITGGIAEGKSTVMGIIRDHGAETLSADDIARKVVAEVGVQKELWQIAKISGEFSSAALRTALAENSDTRRQVNAYLHPLIMAEMFSSAATFFEVPLLIETCLYRAFDRVWVVTCGKEEQIRRLMARYGPDCRVEQYLSMQLPAVAKLAFADVIIRTNQPIEAVRSVVINKVGGLSAC